MVSEAGEEQLMSRIGLGIIGAGKAGTNFARALEALGEQAGIVGFCTAHGETAREAARRFQAPLGTDDLEKLLGGADVDAVIVASPDRFHCEQVIAAARAGKHVLCETDVPHPGRGGSNDRRLPGQRCNPDGRIHRSVQPALSGG